MAFSLYVSTFAALDLVQTSALHTNPHRLLEGTHHTTRYAPDVVKKPHDTPEQNDGEPCDSCDLHEIEVSGSLDLELMALDELKFSSSQDVDLDINGAADVDIFLIDGETLDYEGKGDQLLDLTSSNSLDFLADASLDANDELDTDLDFNDGTVDVDLAENEEYTQDLEFKQNEYIDETIDIPEGAKSIRLRVHNDIVDVDIIKGATQLTKSEAQSEQKVAEAPKKEVKKEEKEEEKTPAAEEVSVSFAAKAKEWIGGDVQKNAILGGVIGAAVAIVGIAVVALFKSRKHGSDPAEDAPADVDAAVELDESELESDSDSDEDVEASVTAVAKEEAEQKKTSVVEGSV